MLLTLFLIFLLSVMLTFIGQRLMALVLERNRALLAEYGLEPTSVAHPLIVWIGTSVALFLGVIVPQSVVGKLLSTALLYGLWLVWLLDFRFQFIFDVMLVPLLLLGLVAYTVLPCGFVERLATGVGAFALFAVLAIVGRGALGGGDAKLAAVFGAWFGLHGTVNAICTGFILGGVAALVLLAFGRRGRRDYFAFGPFLIIGALVAWLQQVMLWK